VTTGDLSAPAEPKGELLHLIPNRAVSLGTVQTAHASVESVVAETTEWAKTMKKRGVKTVDQELLHVIRAVQASRYGNDVDLFIGILVTDNISSNPAAMDITLERAEDSISEATQLRRDFLSKILKAIGVLKSTYSPAATDAANSNKPAAVMRD
jgi:homospermidine synthase